ncbi:trimeric intracellular cation channel family protein [Marinobacter sp. R17]|uniref:trimeric intracellular cation channel family protein n=1 Tax=Marinobacter sp. R17 TaxID=2484250 RepID=UPI000F4CA5AC|nr:trimeric intracellular cation channel family protein [Marinobacter sp. R17]ROU02054.1 trimeric intracellular cation channel family protein [Marinobacter sp. R17]
MHSPDILYCLETIGIVAFALSGMIVARKANMDPVGIFAIAFVTALGGGTLRDLILDNHPLYWINHQEMPVLILVMTLLFTCFRPLSRLRESNIVLPDAIGLGVFSILGAQFALDQGHSWFIASLLGVITGTFGGALRDTLCNEVPFIFRKDQIYASISFAGCWLYFVCRWALANDTLALAIGLLFIVAIRLLAVHFDIRLQRDAEAHG